LSVLDGKIMEPEAGLYLGQFGGVGFHQPDPDKAALVLLSADLGREVELHGPFVLPPSFVVMSTVDDHVASSAVQDADTSILFQSQS
jgi:hypothetical protein